MNRVFFHIPLPFTDAAIPVFSYGTMMVVACVVLMWITVRRAKVVGIDKQVVYDVTLYSLILGVLGARLAFVLFDLPEGTPIAEYFKLWNGGLTFQGGLALGLIFNVIYLSRKKLSFGKVADVFAPGVAIGVGIGRIGCFLNGCCWGKICAADFPLGVRFPVGESSLVWLHHNANVYVFEPLAVNLGQDASRLPYLVHPAQLYTTTALFLLGLILILTEKPLKFVGGQLMALFIMFYSAVRFVVEYWRDDTDLIAVADMQLRPGQLAGVIFFAVALILFLYLRFVSSKKVTEG